MEEVGGDHTRREQRTWMEHKQERDQEPALSLRSTALCSTLAMHRKVTQNVYSRT